jgi:hypothetical protein
MGRKSLAFVRRWLRINSMEEHQSYDPGVYKRLELVRKQFKRRAAEQKAHQAAEKRHEMANWLALRKHDIVRWIIYVFLGILVLGIIWVAIAGVIK